ncbi:MAG: DUF4266 domain-containing protein [Gammaproteobacteria bacterium]|nr:DUF4266 domain-containing protein [Gammaproteobacteria bacterium]
MNRAWVVLITIAAGAAGSGCAMQAPKPWQKGVLAKPEMTMAGDMLELKFNDHTWTSKEASFGGFGVGGGGCGCN